MIIFDEPTSSLSEHDSARLFEVIRRLKAGGIAIVYISHFLEEVRSIAQRYTVLRDGEAVASGSMGEGRTDDLDPGKWSDATSARFFRRSRTNRGRSRWSCRPSKHGINSL